MSVEKAAGAGLLALAGYLFMTRRGDEDIEMGVAGWPMLDKEITKIGAFAEQVTAAVFSPMVAAPSAGRGIDAPDPGPVFTASDLAGLGINERVKYFEGLGLPYREAVSAAIMPDYYEEVTGAGYAWSDRSVYKADKFAQMDLERAQSFGYESYEAFRAGRRAAEAARRAAAESELASVLHAQDPLAPQVAAYDGPMFPDTTMGRIEAKLYNELVSTGYHAATPQESVNPGSPIGRAVTWIQAQWGSK